MEKIYLDTFDMQEIVSLLKEGKCVIGTYSGLSTDYKIDFRILLFQKGNSKNGAFISETANFYGSFCISKLHRYFERALQIVILNAWRKNHRRHVHPRDKMMINAIAKYYDCGILKTK